MQIHTCNNPESDLNQLRVPPWILIVLYALTVGPLNGYAYNSKDGMMEIFETAAAQMALLFAMPPTSNGMFWSVAPSFSATDNLMKELKIGPYDFLRHWTIERLWTEYRTLAGSNHPSNADNDGEAQKPQPIDASDGHRNLEHNVPVPNPVWLS